MKVNKRKDEEQKRQPRRLSLNRETIQILDDPALLERARGGSIGLSGCDTRCVFTTSLIIGAC